MHWWPWRWDKRRTTSSSADAAFSIYKPLLLPEKKPLNQSQSLSQGIMVALIPTSTASFPTKTFCTNNILLLMPAFNQPVFKNSFVSTSNFKISQLFRSLNIKCSVRTLSLDWLLLWDLSDFDKEDKKG